MNRRQLLTLAASAAVLGLVFPLEKKFSAFAADNPDKPVYVTKTDGTSLKGKITDYDKDSLTMDVIGKAKDPTVSTKIPWTEIKHVSNGLTQKKGLQKWKSQNLQSLCLTCHGDAQVFCPTCHGTNHDPKSSVGCPTCKGAMQLACTTKKCDHGIIPCPNPNCLKLTDAGWYKKPDGLRWKRFTVGTGWYEFSEHHCGHQVEKIDGAYQDQGNCQVCGGATTIPDPVCRGTSQMPCPTCVKRTKSAACPNNCVAGLVECPTCKGSGLKV